MTGQGEKIGSALAKAVKAATGITAASLGARLYRTNVRAVAPAEGARAEGWSDGETRLLIDETAAGAGHVVGWSVLKPGGRHSCHRLRHADAFFMVLGGQGEVLTETGAEPCGDGDVIYAPRGAWHGFHNTSDEPMVLVWGVMGAGSAEAAGFEPVSPPSAP